MISMVAWYLGSISKQSNCDPGDAECGAVVVVLELGGQGLKKTSHSLLKKRFLKYVYFLVLWLHTEFIEMQCG